MQRQQVTQFRKHGLPQRVFRSPTLPLGVRRGSIIIPHILKLQRICWISGCINSYYASAFLQVSFFDGVLVRTRIAKNKNMIAGRARRENGQHIAQNMNKRRKLNSDVNAFR